MPWFEDIQIGSRLDLGSYRFTEEEIISFATKYDPQSFHIDPVAARESHFGGLIASGWHTAAVWMKLMIASRVSQKKATGDDGPPAGPSPGFLELKWPNPVRPGDTIRYSSTVVEKIELKSRPDWGIVRSRNEGYNQHGEPVLSFLGQGLIQRKNPYKTKS